MKPTLVLTVILTAILIGCASGNPVMPSKSDIAGSNPSVADSNRVLWGLWQIEIDPDSLTANVVPARYGEIHVNVRKFLEDSPCTTCLSVVKPIVKQPYGIDVTIAIRHPFPGNAYYTGFDVRGIAMLEGSFIFYEVIPPNHPLLSTRAKAGDPAVLNPDGYTKIFNAVEFTNPGILGYSRGKMVPAVWGDPTNTLNAFKAFYSTGQSEDQGGRRGFAAGDEIQRTYQIQIPTGKPFKFWYAVDASWEPPTSGPPYDFSSFPPSANCPEPYRFDFSVISGEFYPTTGSVLVGVDIWDHRGWDPYNGYITTFAPDCYHNGNGTNSPPLEVSGERAHWEFEIVDELHNLNPDLGAEFLVIASSPSTMNEGYGRFTIPVHPAIGCSNVVHTNVLGTGDYSGGTNMKAEDSCFVHDTGYPCDGELLGYISGFAGTVVTTYDVSTLTPETGHGLGGGGWEIRIWGNR